MRLRRRMPPTPPPPTTFSLAAALTATSPPLGPSTATATTTPCSAATTQCYYMEPIKRSVAQPFSLKMPKDRVCKRLKKDNDAICDVSL